MKRAAVVQKIRSAARAKGKTWVIIRQGAQHELWMCGSVSVVIPRHNSLVLGIFRRLERELGDDWWK